MRDKRLLRFVGVDTGYKGGLAVLDGYGKIVEVVDMPTYRSRYDIPKIVEFFKKFKKRITFITIEETFPIPRALHGSSVASWSLGGGFMLIVGIVSAIGLKYMTVDPRTWQAEMLKGRGKTSSKLAALNVAQKMWGSDIPVFVTNRRKKVVVKDGRVDALLIAEYGRRHLCR